MSFPIVLVVWEDAHFDFDAGDGDPGDAYLVETVGFLISSTDALVSIAMEILPRDAGLRAVTHIPQSIVRRIDALGPEVGLSTVPDPEAAATGDAAS